MGIDKCSYRFGKGTVITHDDHSAAGEMAQKKIVDTTRRITHIYCQSTSNVMNAG
jgi:hypothetical protein